MSGKTMSDLAEAMAKIDFAMLTTKSEGGTLASRPMSNNGDVKYDGDSYYFSYDSARTIRDIEADDKVSLVFQGSSGLFGKPPLYVSIEGHADIVTDKAAMADHWVADLERYFPDGLETQGIAMIHVRADRIHYWDGEDEDDMVL